MSVYIVYHRTYSPFLHNLPDVRGLRARYHSKELRLFHQPPPTTTNTYKYYCPPAINQSHNLRPLTPPSSHDQFLKDLTILPARVRFDTGLCFVPTATGDALKALSNNNGNSSRTAIPSRSGWA